MTLNIHATYRLSNRMLKSGGSTESGRAVSVLHAFIVARYRPEASHRWHWIPRIVSTVRKQYRHTMSLAFARLWLK